MPVKVVIYDDVVAARGETFNIPGLSVVVHPHADEAASQCAQDPVPDVVFMDFAMGNGRKSGADAIRALRSSGFGGRIIAISSDPVANNDMREAGANEALPKKALLRSYLVDLGSRADSA